MSSTKRIELYPLPPQPGVSSSGASLGSGRVITFSCAEGSMRFAFWGISNRNVVCQTVREAG